jgi:hypothetical protein
MPLSPDAATDVAADQPQPIFNDQQTRFYHDYKVGHQDGDGNPEGRLKTSAVHEFIYPQQQHQKEAEPGGTEAQTNTLSFVMNQISHPISRRRHNLNLPQ